MTANTRWYSVGMGEIVIYEGGGKVRGDGRGEKDEEGS